MTKLFEVRFGQRYLGQETLNVFHFTRPDTGGTAADCAAAFKEDLLPKINAFQSSALENGLLRVLNVFDLADFAEEELTETGAIGVEQMYPLHDCINFTLRPNTRAVRPGKKRFSGLTEDRVLAGAVSEPTVIGYINTLRTALGSPIQAGSGGEYFPAVVKRVKETDMETGKVTYRMPATEGELVFGGILTTLVNLRITTQRSRLQ